MSFKMAVTTAASMPPLRCRSFAAVRRRPGATCDVKAAYHCSSLSSSCSFGLVDNGGQSLKPHHAAPSRAWSRRSHTTVEAKCPVPPKALSYTLAAVWLSAGFGYLFASHFMYRGIVLPTTKLLCQQMGTGIIAIAGAMCGEAHQHSGPTAAGLAFMAVGLAVVCFKNKALMTPAGYTVCMATNVVTAVYYLWKKYSEKVNSKALNM